VSQSLNSLWYRQLQGPDEQGQLAFLRQLDHLEKGTLDSSIASQLAGVGGKRVK
jgi:hypothetical protein